MPQVARRLPNASQAGMPPSYKIDDEFWNELEAVVGPVPSDARAEIVRAIEQYLWAVSAELTADGLDGATKRLREIQAQAAKAGKVVSRPSTCDADDLTFALLGHNLHHRLIPDGLDCEIKIKIITSLLQAVEAACATSIDQIVSGEHDGRPVGRSWEGLIRKLTEICERNNIPTPVRKDAGIGEQQSPFVYFIDLLQSRFEPPYRHSEHSVPALALAITKARRVPKA
jgi:hypothetical protein